MQRAVPVGEGAMAALLGLDVEDARSGRHRGGAGSDPDEICAVANDNAPGQVVVSGHREAVERAIAIAREHGARRSIMLPVSAPFHSPLHGAGRRGNGRGARRDGAAPAVGAAGRQRLGDRGQRSRGDQTPAGRAGDGHGAVARERAVPQPAEVEEVVEIGAGRVLAGLAKRIAPILAARSVGTPAEVEAFLEESF